MDAERWRRIEELFDEVADLPTAEQLAVLLQRCGDDLELLEQATSLVRRANAGGAAISAAIEGVARGAASAGGTGFEGQRLGSYRVIREIGRGGMGAVFEAERDDEQFHKRVALKIAVGAKWSPISLARFQNERQILAQLEHPNIARLLDGGTTSDGVPFFVMEYVEGEPIDSYAESHRLDVNARVRLFLSVCEAVEHAHQNLVVHRDLKPSNILVSGGQVRLIDFGIAKLLQSDDPSVTRTGLAPATPDYCSPEQALGRPVNTRTDVYGLGLVLYKLLTGERARDVSAAASPAEMVNAICERPIAAPSERVARRGDPPLAKRLRGDLDTIVLAAVQKDPARRYGSAADLGDDLRRYLEGLPITARQDSRWYRMSKFARRQWIPLTAAALVIGALTTGIVVARAQARRATERFDMARQMANTFLFDFETAIRELPGSAAARNLVMKRGLSYLDQLSRDAGGDPALLRELAKGYQRMANLQAAGGTDQNESLGSEKGRLENNQRAVELLRTAGMRGTTGKSSWEYVQALRQLAAAQESNGDVKGVRATLDEVLPLVDSLTRALPEDAEATGEASMVYKYAGAVLRFNQPALALDSGKKAVSMYERARKNKPADGLVLLRLADSYLWQAIIASAQENHRETADGAAKALAALDALPAERRGGRTAKKMRVVAQQFAAEGLYQGGAGNVSAAAEAMIKALQLLADLNGLRPDNAQALMDHSQNALYLGRILLAGKRLNEAEAWIAKGAEMASQRLAQAPADPWSQRLVSFAHGIRAELCEARRDAACELAQRRKADELARALIAARPGDLYVDEFVKNWLRMASLLGKAGDTAGAEALFADARGFKKFANAGDQLPWLERLDGDIAKARAAYSR